MIRFPNPGSEIRIFVTIFRTLYDRLGSRSAFSLDDMSRVLTEVNLASSSGFMGETALRKSTRRDRSRDPLYNQSKMYAELFRALGWISSTENKALLFNFTYLGMHIATADDPRPVVEESVLGINYPNEVIDNKSPAKLRPFATILRVTNGLSGVTCRDELIVGPLSHDDSEEGGIQRIVDHLARLREEEGALDAEIKRIHTETRRQINTLRNYTRFPIGVLEYCGWFTREPGLRLYPGWSESVRVVLCMTDQGRKRAEWLEGAVDLRYDRVQRMTGRVKDAVIRIGFYGTLERARFDISPVEPQLEADLRVCNEIVPHRTQLLFSPYQTLRRSDVDKALGYDSLGEDDYAAQMVADAPSQTYQCTSHEARSSLDIAAITLTDGSNSLVPSESRHSAVAAEIRTLAQSQRLSSEEVAESLMAKYSSANRQAFYPLVAELFTLLGFTCRATRAGINYERWDAIIDDPERSIPIEIKSPSEEEYISVKAVRQALENKIILLSRNTYRTDYDTTSLIVGYRLPNDRADVTRLVEDIYTAYRIRIGIFDLHSLLRLAVRVVLGAGTFFRDDIVLLKGLAGVDDTSAVEQGTDGISS